MDALCLVHLIKYLFYIDISGNSVTLITEPHSDHRSDVMASFLVQCGRRVCRAAQRRRDLLVCRGPYWTRVAEGWEGRGVSTGSVVQSFVGPGIRSTSGNLVSSSAVALWYCPQLCVWGQSPSIVMVPGPALVPGPKAVGSLRLGLNSCAINPTDLWKDQFSAVILVSGLVLAWLSGLKGTTWGVY